MEDFKAKNNILLIFAVFLVAIMVLFSFLIRTFTGKTFSYIFTSLVYWGVFCIPVSFYFFGGLKGIKSAYSKSSMTIRKKVFWFVLAFTPCFGTMFAVFIPVMSIAPIQVFMISFLYALINGTIEELFWRGIYTNAFPNNPLRGYVIPTFLFGLWHISLYFLKDMEYKGGFPALVGGATFMGILWGYTAYKTKSIRMVILAHIITNFFAFSGMIYENWFASVW